MSFSINQKVLQMFAEQLHGKEKFLLNGNEQIVSGLVRFSRPIKDNEKSIAENAAEKELIDELEMMLKRMKLSSSDFKIFIKKY